MKRTLILFALCLFVANVQAKTIKYSDDVYYSGKVNDAGQPFGKGRLTILCHSNRNYFGGEERYKVVIDGKFNGSDVTEGHVTFYFGETQTYSGDVSYEIAPGASQVICKMTNGCFIEYSDVYVVQSELPLTLTINPGPRAQLKFDGTVFDRPQEVSGGIYMTDEEKSLFGEPAMYLQKSEYYVEDALSFRRKTTEIRGNKRKQGKPVCSCSDSVFDVAPQVFSL